MLEVRVRNWTKHSGRGEGMGIQWNREGDRILQEDVGDVWQTSGDKSHVPSTALTSLLLDS